LFKLCPSKQTVCVNLSFLHPTSLAFTRFNLLLEDICSLSVEQIIEFAWLWTVVCYRSCAPNYLKACELQVM